MTGNRREKAPAARTADPECFGDYRSMAQITRQEQNGDESSGSFTATSPARRVDSGILEAMRAPDRLSEGGTAIYAVAWRDGVVTCTRTGHEYEAAFVLYLTATGEQACARTFSGGIGTAARASLVPPTALDPAGESVSAYADQLTVHPEVER